VIGDGVVSEKGGGVEWEEGFACGVVLKDRISRAIPRISFRCRENDAR
jgi:hypothetical protein